MAVAVPSTLPMKLRKVEHRGKAAAGAGGRARVLVTVTVLGSAGPLRFLVDEGEKVTGLIRAALRCYAREGRMPLLGADPADFLLYTANGRSDALNADDRISFNGCRSFLLWQKAERQAVAVDAGSEHPAAATSSPGRKGSGGWKGGLNKFLSFSFKV
ncbi:uncharacterized protein LOC133918872 [Phragmites australis]|uniref:uncharacterized protein LOC133918872 n=1 Tax=Phragmites australis TaxID=29695 RepID=UPI002D77FFCD|nr:uncharacterized protein LOC133918872 [Phragmites australis]